MGPLLFNGPRGNGGGMVGRAEDDNDRGSGLGGGDNRNSTTAGALIRYSRRTPGGALHYGNEFFFSAVTLAAAIFPALHIVPGGVLFSTRSGDDDDDHPLAYTFTASPGRRFSLFKRRECSPHPPPV